MIADAKLAFAITASAALHFSLIYGIGIGVPRSVRSSPLQVALTIVPTRHAGVQQFMPAKVAEPMRAIAHISKDAPIAALPAASVDSVREIATSAKQVVEVTAAAAPPPQIREADSLPKADVPLLVDPTWYEAKELDRYPAMLTPVHPAYPEPAASQNIIGMVTVLLRIDEAGVIRGANVVSAQPEGYFEDAALQAIQTARFTPGQRDGLPVRSQLIIKLRFAPTARSLDADRS